MLTTFKIIPEEASSNYLVFRERREPAQDHSRGAADRGLLSCPFCVHTLSTEQLKMAFSRADWLPTPTMCKSDQVGLSDLGDLGGGTDLLAYLSSERRLSKL